MQNMFVRGARQPYVGVILMGIALLSLTTIYGWGAGASSTWFTATTIGFAGILIGGTVLAYQFPIYLRHNTKICIVSTPLYLMAVLLPVPVAVTAVGLSVALGEMLVSRTRGTESIDIITATARWILIALVASLAAHIQLRTSNPIAHHIPLLLAATLMWVGDLVTLPIVLTPITGERPGRIVRTVLKDGAATEAIQYLLGLVGAVAALWQIWALAMLTIPAVLVYLAFKKEMDPDTFELLQSMADTVDLRDPYTGGHSRRVADLAGTVLTELNMHGQEARLIRTAARIHDLGKMALPDTVLIKPGSLSRDEEVLIQRYPEEGALLLERYPDFSRGIEMVRHHHERWDGRGYPDGLAGTEIPFGARLIAVVDAFDAMVSDRPYRRALSIECAAAILRDGRGRQWDPALVDAFLRSIGQKTDEGQAMPDVLTGAATTPQGITA